MISPIQLWEHPQLRREAPRLPLLFPPRQRAARRARSSAVPGPARPARRRFKSIRKGVETWENHRKVIGKHGKRWEIWEINYKWKLNMIFFMGFNMI